jgi:rsbT co-antagonist protein RsbR
MDVTGVPVVDTSIADHLVRAVAAARLMGATTVLTGLSPRNAQAIADSEIQLGPAATAGDLEDGIVLAGRLLRRG